jgi:hypothetical protein
MRQLAVFDTRYYHSIHKISKSSSMLQKQNYKTVAGLIAVVAVALGVLAVFPYEFASKYLMILARGILGFFRLFRFSKHTVLISRKNSRTNINVPKQSKNLSLLLLNHLISTQCRRFSNSRITTAAPYMVSIPKMTLKSSFRK